MKRSATALFLLIANLCLKSQEISGVVLDKTSNEILPYTNIAVSGCNAGTVSKGDGTFTINTGNLPKGCDSLSFSVIGYYKKSIPISELQAVNTIFLEPKSVNLESVIVSPRSPEEYIRMAVENIPQNYIDQPFNGIIYQKTMVKLNGKYIERSEAIIKGYIMPVTGQFKDTTRLKLLAFRNFTEEESAINSIRIQKKKNKVAVEDLDSVMLNMAKIISEHFGIYTQIDSNLIKQMHLKGYQKEKDKGKYWFEHMVRHEERNLLKIGFSEKVSMAKERGNIFLDEESLAIESYNLEMETSSVKLKMLLWVFGIGFKEAEAVITFKSAHSTSGWIPDLIDINFFIDMEKNRWFAKDVPIYIEISSHLSFLDIISPVEDMCTEGKLVKKKLPLSDQFESDPGNLYWSTYSNKIREKSILN